MHSVSRCCTEPVVEKKPKAEPILWAQPGKDHANESEVVFYALLLCNTHRGRVDELNSWVSRVLLEEKCASELKERWQPEGWGKSSKYQTSLAFEPLEDAHKRVVSFLRFSRPRLFR